MSRPAHERVLARVDTTDAEACWEWPGARWSCGYGMVYDDGRLAPVHRVTYEHLVGPVPEGLTLDHLCRNRPCCNPLHLEPVTMAENNRRGDGWAGRNARKTHCPRGHAYDEENTRTTPSGWRDCRACNRERMRARRKAVA